MVPTARSRFLALPSFHYCVDTWRPNPPPPVPRASTHLEAFLREAVATFDPERADYMDDFLEYSEHFMLGSSQAELQVCGHARWGRRRELACGSAGLFG